VVRNSFTNKNGLRVSTEEQNDSPKIGSGRKTKSKQADMHIVVQETKGQTSSQYAKFRGKVSGHLTQTPVSPWANDCASLASSPFITSG
jgi:hypothetical protein